MSTITFDFPDAGEFVYDSQRPTYYSERYAWALHKHQAALAAAGASVHIETASHADQITAVSTFANNLQAWSDGCVNALVQYLTGGDDAVEPVLPDFPVVPELLESAVSLLPGGKLALLIKGAVPFIKGFLLLKEKLRPTDPVRILDKALLKDSWWLPGLRKSWLQEISEKLESLAVNVDLSPIVDALSTQDCNNTQVTMAEILKRALGECRDIGGGYSAYYGVYELLQQLIGVLSAMSIEVETEKAARVRLSGVDAASEIPFPSNL